MKTSRNMEKAIAFGDLHLLLVGKEKSGKSRTAATGRKPVLFADYDIRAESVAGMRRVYAQTFTDAGYPIQPSAYNDGLILLQEIEEKKTMTEIMGPDVEVNQADKDLPVKTLVLDSAGTISRAALKYALYSSKDIRREIKIGGRAIQVPGGWDAWNADMAMMEDLVTRAIAIPGLDVIMTIHEDREVQYEGSGDDSKRITTGRVGVWPNRHSRLIKYFNEVWRVTRESQTPVAQLIPNWEFTAATNLAVRGNITNPNIEQMLEDYEIGVPKVEQPAAPGQAQEVAVGKVIGVA